MSSEKIKITFPQGSYNSLLEQKNFKRSHSKLTLCELVQTSKNPTLNNCSLRVNIKKIVVLMNSRTWHIWHVLHVPWCVCDIHNSNEVCFRNI